MSGALNPADHYVKEKAAQGGFQIRCLMIVDQAEMPAGCVFRKYPKKQNTNLPHFNM
ncbi:hypothetical protein [Bradyrhizobium sp. LMTR 3]|uniref:hypothetical protein n=1 Tax=Bradyrhizobium sp. LMTR 3 TaxID=189873 RepID=UPI001AED0CDA|nr:hypothetical protein [Bradyrhizobium sp. LMTR 3]